MATTSNDQPRVTAVYVPLPGSRRFVVLLGSMVPRCQHDTVVSEVLGHHLLEHDERPTVRVWTPDSDCPFSREDTRWALAFLNPEWSSADVVAEFERITAEADAPSTLRRTQD